MATSLSRVVLLVDDESTVTDLLEVFLRRAKLETRSAATAQAALDLINVEQFGCALIDKNLPDKNGLAVLAELRQKQPHCGCLMMTGFANYESLMIALRLGIVDYVEKPLPDLGLLVDKVQKVLERQALAFRNDQLVERVKELETKCRELEAALSRR